MLRNNEEFAEKVQNVLREEVEEKHQTQSQEDIPLKRVFIKNFLQQKIII